MSLDDLERKVREHKPRAVFLVHIGGHLAFQSDQIADLCRSEGIILLEDCAHSHGADWDGRRAGSWGDAGIWSFAPTKTISTGEGGMLVSRNPEVIEFARSFRNYGKPDYAVHGLNFRLNEFTAAIGARPDDPPRRDHGLEERGGAPAARPVVRLPACSSRPG